MFDPLTRIAWRNAGKHQPVVLMYHALERISGVPRWTWSLATHQFHAHLDVLRTGGWQTCAIRDLLPLPSRTPSVKTAVITFDDGYANNIEAASALVDRGMRATFFIVAGAIGREPFWPDTGRPAGRMMNATELRDLDARGIEIAAHGVTHVRLPALPDDRLASEVSDSKKILEDVLGKPVTSFAYPYGAWDERCADAVRAAGFLAACTTQPGAAFKDGDPYALRRIEIINRDTTARFMRKLALLTNDGGCTPVLRYFGKRLLARTWGPAR